LIRENAPFLIFDASAGAGKTYNLVKQYLKICLQGKHSWKYREILAITFTNKAANEMKERIIQALLHFSAYPELGKFHSLFYDLKNETAFEEKELASKSAQVLKSILHAYSAFSVSTIDRFTNRLIRSFSHDLKVNGNYEVELDSQAILKESIDRFLNSVQTDSAAAKALIGFIESQLTEGKSPRVEESLLKMAYELFDERAHGYLSLLKGFSTKGFFEVRKAIYARVTDIEKAITDKANQIVDFLQQREIDENIFSYGDLPRFLQKIIEQKALLLPGKRLISQVDGDSEFYSKAKKAEAEAALINAEGELRGLMKELFQLVWDNFPFYHLAKHILKNIHALAVMSEVEHHLAEVKQQSNRLPIGEFNKIISDYLQDQPAAFLYEKIGERYRHYFVDEFQDTSVLQWKNLLPLINNAISSGGDALIVGDAKQAIYRWRGGEVNQFLSLSSNTDTSNVLNGVKLYERQNERLSDNYRSRKNIVDFNNHFFQLAAGELLSEQHQQLFRQASQNPKGSEGGYVKLELLNYDPDNKEAYLQQQCEYCLGIVQEALERGYQLKDIAILTRKKTDALVLSNYLIENNIEIVSEESLMLNQSAEALAIVSFIKMLARPDDLQGRIDFAEYLWSKLPLKKGERHGFLDKITKSQYADLQAFLEECLPGFILSDFISKPLRDKVYRIIQKLKINHQSDPYVLALLDKVQEIESKKEGGETAFLRWWEEGGNESTIVLPEILNALKMMTIHKAKGLEFPITILAFADWRATMESNSSEWLILNPEEFGGLSAAKVSLSPANLELADENYQKAYKENEENIYLDNLNLLYVALTRAEDELHIIGSRGRRDDNKRVTLYFEKYLNQLEVEDSSSWFAGEVLNISESPIDDEIETSELYESMLWEEKLSISTEAPQSWNEVTARGKGTSLHEVMALLKTEKDKKDAIGKALEIGIIEEDEENEISDLIDSMVYNADLEAYYRTDAKVLNEKDLLNPLLPKGRPDRIVITGNKVDIIDYKYGQEQERHKRQVEAYMHNLEEMGYERGDQVLIYLENELRVVKW